MNATGQYTCSACSRSINGATGQQCPGGCGDVACASGGCMDAHLGTHRRERWHAEYRAAVAREAQAEGEADGSPDRPYTLRVQQADAHHEARVLGAVFAYFGHAASRDSSVTSTDGECYRVVVPNLSGGSTSYRVEWI